MFPGNLILFWWMPSSKKLFTLFIIYYVPLLFQFIYFWVTYLTISWIKWCALRIAISHEKQEIKKFCDKKFLTRKTGKKNKKLMKVKKALKSIVKRENFWNFASNLRFLKKLLHKNAINLKIWSKIKNISWISKKLPKNVA